ncbi:MAG TPA: hypothetical protein VFM86_15365 [Pedococcus sp.]|nr:hypothetical protein [Pedococcus sp.]
MSENWKIQVSPKLTDGTLINLRAETPEEAEALFQWAFNKADAIIKTVSAFGAVNNVAAGLGGQVVQQETSQQGSWSQQGSGQTQQQAPAQSGEGKRCAHGEMVFRESKPGAAKAWRAYFCPTPKGTQNQCEPVWLKG